MKRWYVVQTQAGAEEKAVAHLGRQGFDTYLPRYAKRRRHARRVDTVTVPLFPRYLFVGMDLEAQRWRAVHSTAGVSRLVCNGETPAAVPTGVVEEIRHREDDQGLVRLTEPARFREDDPVRITEGPLADRIGLFSTLSDDQRVVVLLDMLGRRVRVRVPAGSVDACA